MKRLVLSLCLSAPLAFADGIARAEGDEPSKPAPAQAAAGSVDVLVLSDGRRLEGEVVGEDDRAVSFKSGGVTRTYARDSITSLEKAPRTAAPADPAPQGGAATEPTKGKKEKGDRRDAPLSDAAKKWLDDLVAKSAEATDESVRRSIAQAIQALGPSAVPALRAAQAAAPEGPQKQFLERVANELEQRREKKEGMGPDGPGGRPGQPKRFVEDAVQRLTKELELTDEQKPKVETVVADWGKKRAEIFGAARRDGLTKEDVLAKVAALRTDVLAQMKAVLTEPQYAMFEEISNALFEMQRAPMPPKPPAKPGEGGEPAPPEK
jgi:hypothetical protein